ncbi:MAG: Rod shape-determining protein RodA [Parcubacteria group bacterium GW2011_GWA2_43_17]|nr:MAG: Rod shape-determining protein RodA [Parcubacteria group bacterium GW2011_GWA2_43_17]KKT91373.1 MAG: Rod shape-determining protein RodA [Parcubacteria group bacterium GW2011_GWF2_45_11]KKT97058.1 MAG: Rod shape-determining protein RodA [Parcubacteria group bacterium GW2011_GWC2_45_15]OGY92409.1 MAG: rod shape-determining protein RodA [Candidatus Komeilibacteria bacterium RIFOXYA2_FULL_45_9]HAH04561.1 rod shape-determining protein RodA [Candidatus Komeilibacteria bacterium]
MVKRLLRGIRYFDWYLIINIILLVFFGLAALYSLQLNIEDPDFTLLKRQITFVIFGLGIFFLFSNINYQFWSDYYKIFMVLSACLLAGVLLVGQTLGGTQGWFEFFGQNLQPVEFVKIALVIFLARYYSQHAKDSRVTRHIFITGLTSLFLIALVILQPDLGSAMILLVIWLSTIFLLPIQKKYFINVLIILLVLAVVSWFFILQDYQQERILTFISPQRDPLGAGYNVTQSVIAVGSGNLIGRGLALGSQSQLNFLPTQETDFIFAVIAEELGFVGAGILLLLFFSLFVRLFKIVKSTQDSFGSFVMVGLMSFLVAQLFINVGMNVGLAPVVGLPLPLVSYGGSSLIATMIALGIMHNIQIQNKEQYFG